MRRGRDRAGAERLKVSIDARPHLIRDQGGLCAYCGFPLKRTDVHHIVPVAEGGGDQFSNLVAVHPDCHRRLHGMARKPKLRC